MNRSEFLSAIHKRRDMIDRFLLSRASHYSHRVFVSWGHGEPTDEFSVVHITSGRVILPCAAAFGV